MNPFHAGADGLMIVMLLGLLVLLRGSALRRMIALQLFTLFGAIVLVLLAVAYDRPDFCDLGIALGLLSFGGTLAYAHFFERWL